MHVKNISLPYERKDIYWQCKNHPIAHTYAYLCAMHNNRNKTTSDFLKDLSIKELNEMQLTFIEKANHSHNLMLLAPTGSGKTLAFLLALIKMLSTEGEGVQALIVAPSRELSLQIEQVFRKMKTSHKVSCCYGGHSMKMEQNSLREAPAVVIGTPGRLADHIKRGSLYTENMQLVVLDEFDKSLQLGFKEQLVTIFQALDGKQRHLLTSATNLKILPDFLPFPKPETVDFLNEDVNPKLKLKLVQTSTKEKAETLMRLVAGFDIEVCLVFCNHRDAVDRISTLLSQNGLEHSILHGGMEQIDREKNLIKFRGAATRLLIATDLASRGLDIPEIKHVVHYQLPINQEAFIHRNGRTARIDAEGDSYLVLAKEETLPFYIDNSLEEVEVSSDFKLPSPPIYTCLYISAGKKNKISKGDIVGLLTKKGGIIGEDIGLITQMDFSSYVSVKKKVVNQVLVKLQNERMKKIKFKIEVAN